MKTVNKIFAAVLTVVLATGLVWLLWAGFYNAPSSDDYGYAIWTYDAWTTTHSLWEVIKSAVWTSKHFWNEWQGLYSSAFVLAFMPGIFGEGAYAATAFLTTGALLAGNSILIYTVFVKLLGAGRLETAILALMTNIIMLQWMPSALQGIYWYNGAMNYTFFYALGAITVSFLIRYAIGRPGRKDIAALAGLSVLGFIIEGGNHITAFLLLCILAAFVAAGFIKKNRRIMLLAVPFVISLTGFMLNIMSPGTKIRQGFFQNRPGILGTALLSVQRTLEDLNSWLNFSYLLVLLALLPILFPVVLRFCKNTAFDFAYPFLVIVASAGCLCLMRCPALYAMGSAGAGRLTNVVYFVFVLLSIADECYLIGWLYTRGFLKERNEPRLPVYLTLISMLFLTETSFLGGGQEQFFHGLFWFKKRRIFAVCRRNGRQNGAFGR